MEMCPNRDLIDDLLALDSKSAHGSFRIGGWSWLHLFNIDLLGGGSSRFFLHCVFLFSSVTNETKFLSKRKLEWWEGVCALHHWVPRCRLQCQQSTCASDSICIGPGLSAKIANISEPSTNEAIEISEVSSDLYLSTKYLDEL
ncbi:hypothetical protein Tco_0814945 [Tanacetum coccineum]